MQSLDRATDTLAGTIADDLTLVSTSRIADIESDWRELETMGLQSPGQSYDFLATWIDTFNIAEPDCQFVVARLAGKPVAALALHRKIVWGMRVLQCFPGGHVGTNAPLVDRRVFATATAEQRAEIWRAVIAELKGAELAYICCLPKALGGEEIYDGFGLHSVSDELHRAVFPDWQTCDREQRTRSRRKHDKQQGAKLNAMGEVSFEVLQADDQLDDVFSTMFAQRHERFRQQGIDDPFEAEIVRRFYRRIFSEGKTIRGKLHVLRLDGEVVAVRYNLVQGDRMFCLISSMSTEPRIQPGSPGKQCLLRVMQTEFDNGIAVFDMGAGLTDEKRHWCNVHIPLRHHYIPLTLRGHMFTKAHRSWQRLKRHVKSDARLFGLAKSMRTKLLGSHGQA